MSPKAPTTGPEDTSLAFCQWLGNSHLIFYSQHPCPKILLPLLGHSLPLHYTLLSPRHQTRPHRCPQALESLDLTSTPLPWTHCTDPPLPTSQVKRELAAVLLFEPHSRAGTVCKSDRGQEAGQQGPRHGQGHGEVGGAHSSV